MTCFAQMLLLSLDVKQTVAQTEQNPLWIYHTEYPARSVAISSDGNYIAAGTDYCMVYLFSQSTNTPLWSYQTWGPVYSVAISSDGTYIAAGNGHNEIYLFSRSDNTPLWKYTIAATIPAYVPSVAISSDGNYIVAAGGVDDHVYLFSRSDNTPLWSCPTDHSTTSVAISSDGSYIAAGGGGKVYLFSCENSAPLWSYDIGGYFLLGTFQPYTIDPVSISSDGNYIVASSNNPGRGVCLFARSDNIPLWSYSEGGTDVAISSDGNYIISSGNRLRLFYRENNSPLWEYEDWYYEPALPAPSLRSFWDVAISSDGSYIVAGGAAGGINNLALFSRSDNTPLWICQTEDAPRSVSISSDGEYIAASGSIHLFSRSLYNPPGNDLVILATIALISIACIACGVWFARKHGLLHM